MPSLKVAVPPQLQRGDAVRGCQLLSLHFMSKERNLDFMWNLPI